MKFWTIYSNQILLPNLLPDSLHLPIYPTLCCPILSLESRQAKKEIKANKPELFLKKKKLKNHEIPTLPCTYTQLLPNST